MKIKTMNLFKRLFGKKEITKKEELEVIKTKELSSL